jgi:hypothetical protein
LVVKQLLPRKRQNRVFLEIAVIFLFIDPRKSGANKVAVAGDEDFEGGVHF